LCWQFNTLLLLVAEVVVLIGLAVAVLVATLLPQDLSPLLGQHLQLPLAVVVLEVERLVHGAVTVQILSFPQLPLLAAVVVAVVLLEMAPLVALVVALEIIAVQ
jgi:hypothetical protein